MLHDNDETPIMKEQPHTISFSHATVLVTGAAGFIGSHLVRRLLCDVPDLTVVGIDNLNDYYDVSLKHYRLQHISHPRFHFLQGDVADATFVQQVFADHQPRIVVHLAAQAGVRHSIHHPEEYISSNIVGFANVLEACRHATPQVQHLVFASSSSVYGNDCPVPYSVDASATAPTSIYAATKRSNELMAYAYAHLYGIPCTGLRFFTVYGPAGRPDMAYYSFTHDLLAGRTLPVFNNGKCERDFTYIDDIVEGIVRVMQRTPSSATADGKPPYAVHNIGKGTPVPLLEFIRILHDELIAAGLLPPHHDLQSQLEFLPMQPGDMAATWADTTSLQQCTGYQPTTTLREGLHQFVQWYKEYEK